MWPIDRANVRGLFRGYDRAWTHRNFETRFLINDAAVYREIPWIYGPPSAAMGSSSRLSCTTACFRSCIPSRRRRAPTRETEGVATPVTATIASLQVADSLKIPGGRKRCVTARLTPDV